MSVDALSGLCQKKAAENSVHPSLNDGLLFDDQGKLDKYIQSNHTTMPSEPGKVIKKAYNYTHFNNIFKYCF